MRVSELQWAHGSAQVVQEVDGYLSVAYAEIVPVLIEALKQHLANDAVDKQEIQRQIVGLDRKLQSFINERGMTITGISRDFYICF